MIFKVNRDPEIVMYLAAIDHKVTLALCEWNVILLGFTVNEVETSHKVKDYTLKLWNQGLSINLVTKDLGVGSDQELKRSFAQESSALYR